MLGILKEFDEAINKFPLLRGRVKIEIFRCFAESIDLQRRYLPLIGVQTAMLLLEMTGAFDEIYRQVENLTDESVGDIFPMVLAAGWLIGNAFYKAKEKVESFIKKHEPIQQTAG